MARMVWDDKNKLGKVYRLVLDYEAPSTGQSIIGPFASLRGAKGQEKRENKYIPEGRPRYRVQESVTEWKDV